MRVKSKKGSGAFFSLFVYSRSGGEKKAPDPFLALVVALTLITGCGPRKPEVRLFTWDSYDDPAVFEEFERLHGIRVVVDRFASNEELLAKLTGGAKGYDVIVPSDYMVSAMSRQGLLAELDKRGLPNLKHMDPRFMGLYYDRENAYCVPYLWGISGIGYDSEKTAAPRGWSALWDPQLAGAISVMNDQREAFAMALQRLKLPVNAHDPAALAKAKASLEEQKRLVKTYNSENVKLLLLSGEVKLAHAWSGDVNQAAEERPSLRFAIPEEGGFIYQDNLCVAKTSERAEAAHKLIDFMLKPENMARVVEKVRFGCPNKAAWKLLPAELRENPTIVLPDAALRRLEWIHDAGQAAPLYDRLWTELKAG